MDARFCTRCRHQLAPYQRRCPFCGKRVQDGRGLLIVAMILALAIALSAWWLKHHYR